MFFKLCMSKSEKTDDKSKHAIKTDCLWKEIHQKATSVEINMFLGLFSNKFLSLSSIFLNPVAPRSPSQSLSKS